MPHNALQAKCYHAMRRLDGPGYCISLGRTNFETRSKESRWFASFGEIVSFSGSSTTLISEVLLKFNDRVREAQKPECNADHFVFYSNGENFLATPITLKTMTSVWTITSIQGRIVVTVPPLGFHGC